MNPINNKSNFELPKQLPFEITINRAMTEIELNTPDSIAIAVAILTCKNITVPKSLKELEELHTKFRTGRDAVFSQTSSNLQSKALEELKNYF